MTKTEYLFSSFIEKYGNLLFYGLAIFLIILVRQNAFFWDTIQLGSRHAHFYFENNFQRFFLPQNIDSGHPPTFGIYLALVWNWFGKSLTVSHFAMLPFLFGIIYYLDLLGKFFFKSSIWVFAFILLQIFDPCLAGQAALVSPDVVLVLFFLMSLYGVFEKKPIHLLIGILGLCLISTRGMMATAAIFVFDFVNSFWLEQQKIRFQSLFKKSILYFPGAIAGLGFLILHYKYTGWIGYHEHSPWAPAFERMDAAGLVKNIFILGWRILDYGRVFLVLISSVLLLSMIKNQHSLDLKTKQLLSLLLFLFIFLTPALLIYKMLLGHRYLLPIYLIINTLGLHLIYHFVQQQKWKNILFAISFLGLSLGNFWIYPKKIAQGWDSTLATLPYFELRQNMIKYIKNNKITFEEVGSVFPNIQPFKWTDLSQSMEHFTLKDFEKNPYIFYSNVFNDFSDLEIEELENEWTPIKIFTKRNICVILYQRPKR